MIFLFLFCASDYRVAEWRQRAAPEETETGSVYRCGDIPTELLPNADAEKYGADRTAPMRGRRRAMENENHAGFFLLIFCAGAVTIEAR